MSYPKLIAILGRESTISVAELESVYGSDVIQTATQDYALLNIVSSQATISRLGGCVKLAEVVDRLETTDWKKIATYIVKNATAGDLFDATDASKKRLGISVYGTAVANRLITGLGLELKKKLKKAGWSVGVTPNKSGALSSAQVLHNRLDTPTKGREIIIIFDEDHAIIGLTTAVQDIDAYAARDQARPQRDAFVGMLPPKLAQIIINLSRTPDNTPLLDPFCGSGVLLQEALLMGYPVLGSDISPRMVEYSHENLTWLNNQHTVLPEWSVIKGDATTMQWQVPVGGVATEMYLGEPQTKQPSDAQLHDLVRESAQLTKTFLQNIHPQLQPGTHLCLAMPAWRIGGRFQSAELVDDLKSMKYNQASFKHVESDELIYARPDQIVGRKLLVLTRM